MVRTAAGRSGEVSRAMRGSLGDAGHVPGVRAEHDATGRGPGVRTYDEGVTSSESPRRQVLLAAPRGYCAGVDRAVVTVEKALDLYGPPVYVRKQIVHNKHVVEELEARGAIFVEETQEVPEGALVVFSAHGVAPSVHAEAAERGLRTIDATCPLVTKVHQEARRFADEGYRILLIGHEGHEEVVGTTGEAPEAITLVDGPHHVDDLDVSPDEKVVWLSQTTLSVDETVETVDLLRQRLPLLVSPPSDDICYATQNRQQAVKAIAPRCDVVVVVGSGNSSNSVRLVEVALDAGARASYRVDNADELDEQWFEGVGTVGVTSGASVPESLVQGVLDWLAARGWGDVEQVSSADERLVFALPPELRRDLKAAGRV
ncbi:MAG: 4-hydroxy-3-methylbut-2-enyl diphosphate reductase [Frankiales bacterium]|nr:4-hydroxy-3-methylbut-2-enyl diphosphate reductase [Frankiales bacterium]